MDLNTIDVRAVHVECSLREQTWVVHANNGEFEPLSGMLELLDFLEVTYHLDKSGHAMSIERSMEAVLDEILDQHQQFDLRVPLQDKVLDE